MKTMVEVANTIEQMKKEGKSKEEIIREAGKLCAGWPYVFGAWGEECTPAGRKKRARDDHPTIVSACQVLNGKKANCTGCKWNLPVRMYDCRGFTYWLLMQVGIKITGEGCTSQWNASANWVVKGPISQMPKDKVCCVFTGTDSKKEHTGMYLGDGSTAECSSGVQVFDPMKSKWKYYAIPKGLYEEDLKPVSGDDTAAGSNPISYPTIRQGAKGDVVKTMQTMLAKGGSTLVIDGIFGSGTRSAVMAFQRKNGLVVDGICGPKTWGMLIKLYGEEEAEPTPVVHTYTVTLHKVSEAAKDELLQKYDGTAVVE